MHPEAAGNHCCQPLNFEPVCHWVFVSALAVKEGPIQVLSSGSAAVANGHPCQQLNHLNFRTLEPVLRWSRCVLSVVSVAECPFQVHLHWKEVLPVTADWISGRLGGWKKRSFLCPLWVQHSICCQKHKGSIRIKSQRLNFWISQVLCQSCIQVALFGSLEASNQAMFPVESLLGTSHWISQWWIEFHDVWIAQWNPWKKRPIQVRFKWNHC